MIFPFPAGRHWSRTIFRSKGWICTTSSPRSLPRTVSANKPSQSQISGHWSGICATPPPPWKSFCVALKTMGYSAPWLCDSLLSPWSNLFSIGAKNPAASLKLSQLLKSVFLLHCSLLPPPTSAWWILILQLDCCYFAPIHTIPLFDPYVTLPS